MCLASYWTLGQYDALTIVEAPDAATMTAINLTLARQGNVRTQTLPAVNAIEIGAILDKML